MTKKAIILLANGYEETEAIGAWDALRRGGVDARFVSINDTTAVEGAHGLHFVADTTLSEVQDHLYDAVALPGGLGGANNLNASKEVRDFLQKHYENGRVVAAMCAAPIVLADMGLLKGKKATAYPGFEGKLDGAEYVDAEAVIDGNIVTARGPVYGLVYGVAILSLLEGKEKAREVADGLLIHEKGVRSLDL